jgi:4-oxalocrotonate tautomerase
MPHVIIKLWPGKTAEQKAQLSDAITASLVQIMGSKESSVSVAFEEVPSEQWMDQVYGPDIQAKWDSLQKPPGYGPGRE